MERFQELVLSIERRARLARGLEGAGRSLSATLSLTLGYQALRLLGLVGAIEPYWLVFANLLVGLAGFLWSYLQKVDLPRALFQADRRLGLHERLSALYELARGRGPAEFIPLLTARLPPRLEVARAVPLARRRSWLLPTALILATLLLGLPREIAPWPTAEERAVERGGQEALERKLAALEEQAAELEEELAALALERRPEVFQERGARARELQEQLEEELWGPSTDQALRGEILERLSQALSSPAAREGEEEGAGQAERAELQAELGRLASRLTGGLLKDLLQRLPELGRPEAQQNLAAAQALAESLAKADEELERSLQLAGPASASRGEEEGSGASPEGEGSGEPPTEGSQEGGEEAGTSRGSWPAGEPLPLSWPSGTRELHISGELGEWGEVEQLLTRGTPFEAGGAEAPATLRLNLQRVIAILESRNVPEEVQETVKQYFLIITEE
ncbi:MAG: hypothetical protein NUW06_04395 [Candidatus Acetothermia bacterium]|jgi:hypothetical protein|nr:hypothetical protein [Candidatus Acetothermia bacterium]MDH7505300.1 hypothetical protein [Candidatus Acetothermia bacterium]